MMEIKTLLISTVLALGILLGLSAIALDVSHTYNINQTKNLTYYKTALETEKFMNETSSALQQTQMTGTPLDVPLFIVQGSYAALKLTLGVPNILKELINSVAQTFNEIGIPIPVWATTMLVAIVSLIVIFGIFKAIFKV